MGARVRRAIATVFAVAGVAACAPEASRTAGQGTSPTIVSLNPCLDAILVNVAAPEQVLALSHYSRDPSASSMDLERARTFGVTGGTAEEVLALKPDIVLASSFIAPSKRAAFERLGLRVETFGSPVTVAESVAHVRQVAALAGRGAAGEELVRRIESSVSDAERNRRISTLLWQPGQIVPGEATLIGELLRESGFTSQSAARGLGQGDYVALETLLADPPELLLVAGDSVGQRHPMLGDLGATHVESLDTRLLFCGGPTIIDVRERLRAIRERIDDRNEALPGTTRQARLERLRP